MLFNSLDFAIFLPIVFVLYWFVTNRSLKLQNLLIVIASYIFYGWWDYRFLVLILFSTIVDYWIGLLIHEAKDKIKRKIYLWCSILVNVGLLGFFKYFNFFVDNFVQAFSFFGHSIQPNTLDIILPVGISFYTFQTLSYSIDIYRLKMEPTKEFISFAAFVSFFPQLVAGPIERATNLLPQFKMKREFVYSQAIDGLRQILWGMFKKILIADNCAKFVNIIFNDYNNYSASTLFLGVFLFAMQIYGDFSGYSDIAIGTSRLFGFNLKQNFAFPYFSRDVAEFWRRWHISLSTWFRDYVYIPLGGSKGSKLQQIRNVLIIFVVSGFWHGANWTFVVWGALNAIYFLPLLLFNRNRINTNVIAENSILPSFREFFGMAITFCLILLSWIFFRADNLNHAWHYLIRMLDISIISLPQVIPPYLFIFIAVFMLIEWAGRRQQYALETLWLTYPQAMRWFIYYCMVMIILLYGGRTEEFIYFQF